MEERIDFELSDAMRQFIADLREQFAEIETALETETEKRKRKMSKFYSVTASKDQSFDGRMWETAKYCLTERKAKKILERMVFGVLNDILRTNGEYVLHTMSDDEIEPDEYETEDGTPIFYEYRSEMEYHVSGEWEDWYVAIEEKEMEEDEDDE